MNRDTLQRMYGSTPQSFQTRIEQTLAAGCVPQETRRPARRNLRVALVCTLVLTLLAAIAAAAFSSQVAEWFGRLYGTAFEEKLQNGDIAPTAEHTRLGDAVFTVDEVTYIDGGLYLVGRITPAEDADVLLIAEDFTPDMAAGYDCQSGEVPPENAPTYAELAKQNGTKLLSVRALAEAVGVDGGDVLTLGSVGYALIPQRDGSVRFLCELPSGLEAEHGSTYTVQLWISQMEMTLEGKLRDDTYLGTEWTVTVRPKPMKEGQAQ